MTATIKPQVVGGQVDSLDRRRTLDTRQSFLVQAPAGSGKTELLIRRFLKLLAEVDEPEQILAITFTLDATAEMRARVLKALREAGDQTRAAEDPDLTTLVKAALRNDEKRNWHILQQPQRLNIQTIDAVCLAIAHQTPLLSRLGGSLTPTDKPQPLYTLAARRTLARLGGGPEISEALRALLQLRGTSLPDCEHLIADMLDKRDQWGRVLPLTQSGVDWLQVRERLQEPLRREHARVFAGAQSQFALHPALTEELLQLLQGACGQLAPDSELLALRRVTHMGHFTTHLHWRCLCKFLLTGQDEWRKQGKEEIGFVGGPSGKAAKQRFKQLLGDLESETDLLTILCQLRSLPPAEYTDEEWQMLRNMAVILRYATAELRLVFAERKVVDFVELGLAARQVLCDDEGELSELAADVAAQWRHLLVDEFQDTSRSQYELITLLAAGWESTEPGTCFLVGDPMQSIYMFRQAEVELFERTLRHGLGEGSAALHLTPLKLQMNFRSHAGLVNRLNNIFAQLFARTQEDGTNEYHVSFAPSTAYAPAPRGNPGVRVWPFYRPSRATPEEKQASEEAEAKRVLAIIQEHWPAALAAKQAGGRFQIAVLVRAKSHLDLITRKLRKADIPFRAVEIEQLGERQEILDLTALTRALLQPMDRIAWLSVLRAPWCGLSLRDLHILCGRDAKEFANQPVSTLLRDRTSLLSSEGQRRADGLRVVLDHALRGKHRQVSLARWIERTWLTLGGRGCVDETGFENVRAFFAMMEELGPAAEGLENRLAELYARPDPEAHEEYGVQLMTIHKAKGLGFDVVIVPGLERVTRPDAQPLVRWMEQTRLVGPLEQEEREFVVAPIGRNAEPGAIYEWIGAKQRRREDDEGRRLLYVAATRARSELHLLGTATVKVSNGVQELSPGSKHTLLGIAWEALKPSFHQAFQQAQSAATPQPQQVQFDFTPPRNTIRWCRVAEDWQPLQSPDPIAQQRDDVEIIERPRGSLAARAFGIVVHALLEDLSRLPGIGEAVVGAPILEQVSQWRPRALALLRAKGLPRAEAEPQSAEVVRALLAVLCDPYGLWILGPRAAAQTEASWSAWAPVEGDGEIIRTLRGDRIFRAGATPGSLDDTHLWIIDYKTARHGDSGLEDFLAEEKAKYSHQLEAYAGVMRKVHGESTQLRLALYYPLLTRLVWW